MTREGAKVNIAAMIMSEVSELASSPRALNEAPSKKAQRGQNHNARQGHNRAKKAGKGGAPKQ